MSGATGARDWSAFARAHQQVLLIAAVLVAALIYGVATVRADLPFTNADCWGCHDGLWHTSDGTIDLNCNLAGCHTWTEDQVPLASVPDDHGPRIGVQRYYDCTSVCHNPVFPSVPQHTAESVNTAHLTTAGFDGCESCHAASLFAAYDPPRAGHASCAVCHDSTDAGVIAVIGDWDGSCGACHSGFETAHVSLHDDGGQNATCTGAGCHATNLVNEHDGGCAVCHSSASQRVIATIEAGSLSCTSCHPVYHVRSASLDPYLAWDDALFIMERNGITDPGTPHGGYTANTTKCAVCHSVHRAASDRTESGVGSYWKLTQGGNSCIACHTPSGSNPTDTLVEWPSTYSDGGPHRSFGCMGACHAGIHGFVTSEYDIAARFLLNPELDAGMDVAIATGNVGGAATLANIENGVVNKGTRAMVTGYLCAQAGCHTSSQFAVNTAGYAGMRASDPAQPDTLDVAFTGHNTGYSRTSCATSGCHQAINANADSNCASCHDFVGRATGTSAWPHANRGIEVYEWIRPTGTLETIFTAVERGNLWMYTGDATYRDASGEPTATAMWDGSPTGSNVEAGLDARYVNTRTVLQGNSAFDLTTNTPGNIRDGVCLKCHMFGPGPRHGRVPNEIGFRADGTMYVLPDATANFARY